MCAVVVELFAIHSQPQRLCDRVGAPAASGSSQANEQHTQLTMILTPLALGSLLLLAH
jgi:hypothetical protein